jgi:hypothetical protein
MGRGVRHWRIYGEETLAGNEAALWLAAESLTVEHSGEPLSRYEVRIEPDTGELKSVSRPRLFETSRGYRKKIAEGKSHKEALRCLKRRFSDAVFRSLVADSRAPSRSAA